jgi:hypothetical protein
MITFDPTPEKGTGGAALYTLVPQAERHVMSTSRQVVAKLERQQFFDKRDANINRSCPVGVT